MPVLELSEQISNYGQQGIGIFALWISIVAAYLVAAYLAGAELNASQVFILNTVYLMTSTLVIFGIWGSFKVQAYYAIQIREVDPNSPHIMNYFAAMGITAVAILGLLASVKFMWDIRHPKTK